MSRPRSSTDRLPLVLFASPDAAMHRACMPALQEAACRVSSALDLARALKEAAACDLLVLDAPLLEDAPPIDLQNLPPVVALLETKSPPPLSTPWLGYIVASLAKPFSSRELIACLRQNLPAAESKDDAAMLRFEGFRYDRHRRLLISASGLLQPLTLAEAALLDAFLARPGQSLSRAELDRLVPAGQRATPGDFQRIDALITRLRRKLERPESRRRLIETRRNRGYCFTAQVSG